MTLVRSEKATPAVVVVLMSLAWLTAPWTSYSVGLGVRIGTAFAALALLAVLIRRPRSTSGLWVPRPAANVLVGVGLIVASLIIGGLIVGEPWRLLITPLGLGLAAALPLVLLLRARADSQLLRALAVWFVLGVAVSVLAAGMFGLVAPGVGRWIGLAGHMNQLGATCAMALPLIRLCFAGHRWRVPGRLALWLVMLLGLQQSGARSSLIAALVVVGLLTLAWVRRGPKRLLAGLLITLVALVGAVQIETIDFSEQSTLGRLTTEGGVRTDATRASLVDEAISHLSTGAVLIGGAEFERAPHNIYLEVWARGGLLGLAGLLFVFLPPVLAAVRTVLGRQQLDLAGRTALSVLAFLVAVALNNALWFPYTWMVVAIFAIATTNRTSEAS